MQCPQGREVEVEEEDKVASSNPNVVSKINWNCFETSS
jgi:hypothetical protein